MSPCFGSSRGCRKAYDGQRRRDSDSGKEMHHPILKPIEFDIVMAFRRRGGHTGGDRQPQGAATRDQRKLAAAQLLQAGILPNRSFPMLSVPTGGATQEQ